jgi:hypothetical protein
MGTDRKQRGRGYKKVLSLLLLGICLGLFSGCSSGKLADSFSRETLESTSEQIINEALVQGAAAVVEHYMREDFLEDYPLEDMEDNLLSLQSGKGEFLYFQKITMRGETSPKEDSDEDLAVVLVTATFEKGEILFYLTYDTDMNLVSFYVQ